MASGKRRRASGDAIRPRVKRKTIRERRIVRLENAKPTAASSYLDKLPIELISEIWKHCREPCLIHTSRRLHSTLISYVAVTKYLAVLALAPSPGRNMSITPILSRISTPIPGIQLPLPEEDQVDLLWEVFSSHWFDGNKMVLAQALLARRIIEYELISEDVVYSQGQLQKVRKYLEEVSSTGDRHLSIRPFWKIGGRKCTIRVHFNHISFSTPSLPTYMVVMTDVKNVPDRLLEGTMTRQKSKALSLISNLNTFWASPPLTKLGILPVLKCSKTALNIAFKTAMLQPDMKENYIWFRRLLELDDRCFLDNHLSSAIDCEVVRAAAVQGRKIEIFDILRHFAEDECIRGSEDARLPTQDLKLIIDDLYLNATSSHCCMFIEAELQLRSHMAKTKYSVGNTIVKRLQAIPFVLVVETPGMPWESWFPEALFSDPGLLDDVFSDRQECWAQTLLDNQWLGPRRTNRQFHSRSED